MFNVLRNKVCVVTGSTSGIGLAVAQRFAQHGCNVVLNGFGDAAQIEENRVQIERKFGVKALYINADLKIESDIARMFEKTVSHFGSCDVLVNNAGIQYISPVEHFPTDRWNDIISLNLTAVFLCTRAALPHMRKANWGRIINIASVHGLVASKDKSAYVAAKHGVVGFTKAVALETAETNITCNAVCPGWVKTELIQKQIELKAEKDHVDLDQAAHNLLREKQPSMAFVSLDQLADVVTFLASDSAAQIRGAALPIDGAWTAQ